MHLYISFQEAYRNVSVEISVGDKILRNREKIWIFSNLHILNLVLYYNNVYIGSYVPSLT